VVLPNGKMAKSISDFKKKIDQMLEHKKLEG